MAADKNAKQTMIEAAGLSKFYGEFAAVRDVTFSVPVGQVCAFLGPNGAGKSTTMKMLTGYLAPSEGGARIGGFDVATDRLQGSRDPRLPSRERPVVSGNDPRVVSQVCG